eukprot:TRINITY_DN2037_c0_g1_i1.p1 TRINITY_DN2037_c0_g1~~TRINITY_DN2037_c0_g1_i1.p1  ORF type:complete len:480 (-),score=89.12 TRINITY_DN2037_c0_g1_i1:2450-3889(-)
MTSDLAKPDDKFSCTGTNWKRGAQKMLFGVGFMTDAFDLFIMNLVLSILAELYPQTPAEMASTKGTVAMMVMVGAIVGMISFSFISSKTNSVRGLLLTTFTLIVLGATTSAWGSWQLRTFSVYQFLMLWRFLLGVGIGGEYPLSAKAAHSSEINPRYSDVAFTFSMQGVGQFLASLTVLALLYALPNHLDLVWRLSLFMAAIYAIPALPIRWTMAASKKTDSLNSDPLNSDQLKSDELKGGELKEIFTKPSTIYLLIGTAGTWFLFDIVFYANGMFSSEVLSQLNLTSAAHTPVERLTVLSGFNLALCAIALPGYWLACLTIDKCGLKFCQVTGLLCMAVCYITLGALYVGLTDNGRDVKPYLAPLFIILYGLSFTVANWGPNTTTYVYPMYVFEPKVNAFASGIAAAAGKAGALLGSYGMSPLQHRIGPGWVMVTCGFLSLACMLLTLVFLPSDADIASADRLDSFAPCRCSEYVSIK